MPSLTERFKNSFFKNELNELEKQKADMRFVTDLMLEGYYKGPRVAKIDEVISQLKEIDSQYIDLILRRLKYGQGTTYKASEQDRLYYVDSSRRMYDNDVIVEAIIDMWNDFGFGLNIEIIPKNDNAKVFWKDFWTSKQNSYVLSQREIHNMSTLVLRDGDCLLVFFTNTVDGTTSIRLVESDFIRGGEQENGIICLKDDAMVPVVYQREIQNGGTSEITYFLDWRQDDFNSNSMEELNPSGVFLDAAGTKVRGMLLAHRMRGRRGWPLMTTGIPWSIAYRDFTQDMAAVAKAVNMYIDKLVVDSGQSAIDQVVARLQSSQATGDMHDRNPKPPAGSTWVENKAVTRERMPLSTGASESDTIGSSLLGQAGLAGRVYPHWLGKGEAYRLATATAMEQPVLRAFNRYQLFWSSSWRDVAKYVLQAGEDYGSQNFGGDYAVDVNTDSIINTSTEDIVRATSSLLDSYREGLIPQPVAMIIVEQLQRVCLQTIGIDNVGSLFQDAEKEIAKTPVVAPTTSVPTSNNGAKPQPADGEKKVVPQEEGLR